MSVGPGWHVDGVDAKRFKQLVYVRPANAFVGIFEDDDISCPKLYYRQVEARRWRRFPSLGRGRFVLREPVFAESAPYVFLNVAVSISPEKCGSTGASDWSHVARFNPATGELTRVFDKTNARFPKGVTHGWVSRLMGASPRGDVLYASAPLMRARFGPVPYFVVRIALRTGVVTPVTLLRNMFF